MHWFFHLIYRASALWCTYNCLAVSSLCVHQVVSESEMLQQNRRLLPDETSNPLHIVDGEDRYFIGIIDFFTRYTFKKKLENAYKSVIYKKLSFSTVHPKIFRRRFIKYWEDHTEWETWLHVIATKWCFQASQCRNIFVLYVIYSYYIYWKLLFRKHLITSHIIPWACTGYNSMCHEQTYIQYSIYNLCIIYSYYLE